MAATVLNLNLASEQLELKTPYCNTPQRIAIRLARVPARKVLRARGTG